MPKNSAWMMWNVFCCMFFTHRLLPYVDESFDMEITMKTKQRWAVGLLATSLLTLPVLGCGGGEDTEDVTSEQTDGGELVQSELQRQMTPSVSSAQQEVLTEGNTAFALDLYGQLKNESGNIMASPFSVSIAMAMLYAGAKEETATQLENTLRFNLPQEELHPAFNALDLTLESRANPGSSGGEPFELSVVNALWADQAFTIMPSYLDTLALNYGAGLRKVDFMNQPDLSRQTINKWVEGETNQRIKDLLPPGSITDDVKVVLTNAIYFKAKWLNPFPEGNSSTQPFTLADGSTVDAEMMTQDDVFGFATASDGTKVVEMPYTNTDVSMVLVVPPSGQFGAVESGLDSAGLEEYLGGIESTYIDLTIPKYEFESKFSLSDAFQALGLTAAFGAGADFTGISEEAPLELFDVLHKSFVAVDEEGTEAAAATGAVVGATSAQPIEETLVVDRPFLFLIRDKPTGAILFLGRVSDPSQ